VDKTIPTLAVASPIGDEKFAPENISGTAVDHPDAPLNYADVSLVELEVYDTNDEEYWTGSTWSSTATWFGVGNTTWEYSVPDASDTWTDGHTYRIKARATDGAQPANSATSSQVFFTYDKTKPASVVSVPGKDKYYQYGQPQTLSGTASDTLPGSDVDTVEVAIKKLSNNAYWGGSDWLDPIVGENWVPVTNYNEGTGDWTYTVPYPTSTWTDGLSYAVWSRATDKAANQETVVSSNVFTADHSVPRVRVRTRHPAE